MSDSQNLEVVRDYLTRLENKRSAENIFIENAWKLEQKYFYEHHKQ